jgi:zinc transport system substrate-binding protein
VLKVVATTFAPYDFARQINGGSAQSANAEVSMLVPPGTDTHSFEPTPQDIIAVQQADVFVYAGGDSDAWVDKLLSSVDMGQKQVIKMVDVVPTVSEQDLPGMQADPDDAAGGAAAVTGNTGAGAAAASGATTPEVDEHVWTSPKNAELIAQSIEGAMAKADPAGAPTFQANCAAYVQKLQQLDTSLHQVVNSAQRKEIVVADRFPFRYLADELGLTCYAAFPGCSTQTEANPQTVAFLIDKVKADKLPVVFYIELSTHKVADQVAEATGAQELELDAIHNVTADEMNAGATYLSLMERNLANLKVALN